MSILDVVKLTAPKIGLAVPSVVFTATTREMVEMQACIGEMASRIAHAYDWQALKVLATITGDGVTDAFSLPTDYSRQLKKAKLWPSATPNSPLSHIPDSDEWLGIKSQNFQLLTGAWTIYADQIHITPAPAAGVTIQYFYIRNTIVRPAAGTVKASFTADDDSFVLSERLLKLGITWQWKADKGRAYAEDMQTYEDALSEKVGDDKGSKILVVGRQRLGRGEDIAFPGTIVP